MKHSKLIKALIIAFMLGMFAVANGEKGYCDPITGNYTFTAASLKEQGFCCQNKCRHCPWPPEEQLPLSQHLQKIFF